MNLFNNSTGFFQKGSGGGTKFDFGAGLSNLFSKIKPQMPCSGGGCGGGSTVTANGFKPMMTQQELEQLHPEWFQPQQAQQGQMPFIPQKQQQTSIASLQGGKSW